MSLVGCSIVLLLCEICLTQSDSFLDYSLTVWPQDAAAWQYMPCSVDQEPEELVVYMHFSQANNEHTGGHPPIYRPCHCSLYPGTHTTGSLKVDFINNYLNRTQHNYGFYEWEQSNPQDWLALTIQAHADYTVVDVLLNEGFDERYYLKGDRTLNIRVNDGTMTLDCGSQQSTSSVASTSTTVFVPADTPSLPSSVLTTALPTYSTPNQPTATGPTYVILHNPSSSTTTAILPVLNDSLSSSEHSARSHLKLTTFVAAAVVIVVVLLVVAMVIILLVTKRKSDRRKNKKKRKKIEKKNSFVEKAGNVYSTTITESDQCEDSSEDMLCEDISSTSEYTALNNLSTDRPTIQPYNRQLSPDTSNIHLRTERPNNQSYHSQLLLDTCNVNLSTERPTNQSYHSQLSLDTRNVNVSTDRPKNQPYNSQYPPDTCNKQHHTEPNVHSRICPLQHNNICYQKNCVSPYLNNINTEGQLCPQPMNKAQNVDDFMFYPEITPISPELMHELNSRFPGGFPAEAAEVPVHIADRSSTLPSGMTTFRQAPHANVNQIKFQNANSKGVTLDLKQQRLPLSKLYSNENNQNRALEERIYNPVYVNLYQDNPKYQQDTTSHYAHIDPTSLVKLEKPIQNNHKENLIYAELDLHRK